MEHSLFRFWRWPVVGQFGPCAAVAVAVVALIFARASDAAFALFQRVIQHSVWWALLLTPAVFAALAWLTNGALKPTRGSGIPQVIAALQLPDRTFRKDNLSLGVSAGKLALTVLALFGGASVGREGPTVHVGASLMYLIGRALGFRDPREVTHFLLAGGAPASPRPSTRRWPGWCLPSRNSPVATNTTFPAPC